MLLEKIIGKHAIKLKIHATPIDMKKSNSKSINKTIIKSYPNKRELSPSRSTINQKKKRQITQIIPHKHLTITIHT